MKLMIIFNKPKQGIQVKQDKSSGVLLNNHSLVIQDIRRQQAGKYTCTASNVEGDSESKPFHLNVQCKFK